MKEKTFKDSYKILILSDTHGDLLVQNRVIQAELPFDYLINCGGKRVKTLQTGYPGSVRRAF